MRSCPRLPESRGLCHTHYTQWRRGRLEGFPPDAPPPTREPTRLNVYEQTRGACMRNAAKCAETQCRYHLAEQRHGAAVREQDLSQPCAMRLAYLRGPMRLDEIGWRMGLTRERIRQIEHRALRKLQHSIEAMRRWGVEW
ncbi:MAG TPA: sigma factor-like helix-turn-helix DNA-binding protein [Gaiellales bacterium]|nr:sigma factor-like helix-turn-helix DNA-binding protein [Gaiellales bacterium]